TLLGIDNSLVPMKALLFDGTTVGASVPISQHRLGRIAADGVGGFGVVTFEDQPGSRRVLRFLTYDGASWSAESLIAELQGQRLAIVALARFNTTWAVLYSIDDVPTVAILSNGTWTPTVVPGATGARFAMTANGGKLAVASNTGFAAVYASGAWAPHLLETSVGELDPRVEAFADGFVAVYGGQRATTGGSPLRAAVYDGSSWEPATTLSPIGYLGQVDIATSGNRLAVGFLDGLPDQARKIAIYANGAWAPIANIASGQGHRGQIPKIAVENGAFRTVNAEPGRVETRIASAETWSSPGVLPATPTPGGVFEHAVTRAGNGHALATWTQRDGNEFVAFASELDGTRWGAPIEILRRDGRFRTTVAANASSFIVAWSVESVGYIARWTGSGLGPSTALAYIDFQDEPVLLASDGTRFLATWSEPSPWGSHARWSQSTDGVTWTYPGNVGVESVRSLVGGPAGVLAWTVEDFGRRAQLWHNGVWSSPTDVPSWYDGCHGAVGTTTALAVCMNQPSVTAPIQAALFSGGTWTTIPIAGTAEQLFRMALGTNGTDYRLDYFRADSDAGVSSALLHNGVWSIPVAPPGVNHAHHVTALCGGWAVVYGDPEIRVGTAVGSGSYALDHATSLTSPPRVIAGPERLDAFWLAPTPTSFGQPMFHVQLGM
ncbi:MAG: hypothetical protein ACTHU0_26040, partial [Kofleriaceae bacterium]